MKVRLMRFLARICCGTSAAALLLSLASSAQAEPVVPGTGTKVEKVGDDFEDPEWKYYFAGQKSTYNLDENRRYPSGRSANRRWYEGIKRGHPDIVKRIETPAGGIEGSTGALLLQSRFTGYPGRPSYRAQQDDFICNIYPLLGGKIPVWQSPNCVTRVYLPKTDQWEKRNGSTFAFRLALDPVNGSETYWPGMILRFESKARTGKEHDYAHISVRGNRRGQDYRAKQISTTGWWTMGMSVTPDGMVHYYAKPGVEDLTEEDHIASEYPYGYRARRFRTFFFNVLSADNGRSWSTPWVIDDAEMYYIPRETTRVGESTKSTVTR